MKNLFSVLLLTLLIAGCSSMRNNKAVGNSFTQEQVEMIMSSDSSRPMRVFKITNTSDSILLRTKSEDVTVDPSDPVLRTFVNRLYKTVTDSMSLGAGIAAPQVGILKNIIWVQRFDKENFPYELFLNPKIIQYSELKQDCLEGCLSIPDRRDTTKTRSYAVLVEYDKLDNTHHVEMVEDFTAVIFQHEIDHLNGILYLDHLQKEIKDAAGVDR
ncbi:peptide deformylase [Autumnicola edwardsiae]|uniref:Peptide deformylase n=1 Tax=Autumnicola edwardsiae TaxID=3075594 RepID=A0ABU3CU49_9FLAO|nr:peptide deformylase [Zunongwangia sp. F297]MDT0649878.1 peptide deformylase [Zunongwangia sp. F297]